MQDYSRITQRGDKCYVSINGRVIECETYSAALDLLAEYGE